MTSDPSAESPPRLVAAGDDADDVTVKVDRHCGGVVLTVSRGYSDDGWAFLLPAEARTAARHLLAVAEEIEPAGAEPVAARNAKIISDSSMEDLKDLAALVLANLSDADASSIFTEWAERAHRRASSDNPAL